MRCVKIKKNSPLHISKDKCSVVLFVRIISEERRTEHSCIFVFSTSRNRRVVAISAGDIFSSSLSPLPFLCLYSHDVRRLSCVENNRDKNSSDLFRESANERKTEERIAKRRGVKNEEEREKEREIFCCRRID